MQKNIYQARGIVNGMEVDVVDVVSRRRDVEGRREVVEGVREVSTSSTDCKLVQSPVARRAFDDD